MKIISNHHWHNALYGYELTDEERAEFPYIFGDDSERSDLIGPDDGATMSFARYRGWVYDLSEFMVIPESFARNGIGSDTDINFGDWQGYSSDSFFSGIVIRWSDDCEEYQIGTYVS